MRNILLFAFFVSYSYTTMAQSLIKFGITYTIGKEQSYLGQKIHNNQTQNVNSSFGGGLTFDLGYIYLNNNNFGPEATFSFFLGKPKTINHFTSETEDKEIVIKRKMLFFSPALFIVGTSTKNINPYVSSGLLFNLWQDVKKIETTFLTSDQEKSIKVWQVNYQKGIGYKSKVGALYNNNTDDLVFFGEIQYQMLAVQYKNEKLQSYTVNNEDKLSTLSISEKLVNYQMELNEESNEINSPRFNKNKPLDIGMKYANHNHFGASTGLLFITK